METVSGRVIKGYQLIDRIGTGGFGAVYRAIQSTVGREVAIKVILPGYANQPEFIRRFETEAQLIARLEHLNIIPLYDYWRDPQGAYLVMRYLRGGSLRDALDKGSFELEDTALLLDQLAGALTAAHRSNIIHRDIKPSNVLLDEDGNAYLSDFGIAKDLQTNIESFTNPDSLIGSPDYLSPEQARAGVISPQTDIYSLGVLLYETLTGEHPFPNASVIERIYKHLNDPLPKINRFNPDVNERINNVIQKATKKNPAHRYESVGTLAEEFREAAGLGVSKVIVSPVEFLTPREQAVLKGVINGKSNREIAEELVIELSTVRWYLKQIYKKLNVRSRVQAIVKARELNLILGEYNDLKPPPTTSHLPEPENPYKGLLAFETADEQDFFGREKLVDKLLRKMADNGQYVRFVSIVGPSGSGKSSLVKAGLIPELWRGKLPGSENWYVIEMKPGSHPLDELEVALIRISAEQGANIGEQLRRDKNGLLRAAKIVLPEKDSELLIVVDQFEELFTLVEDEETRKQFLELIFAAVTDKRSRVRIVITLRADFYDRPLQYADFGELMRSRVETVLPLSAEELERAIVQPSKRVGVDFEEGVVAAIIDDILYEPGGLPLMQYALTELFQVREGRKLTLESYQQIGRAVGALGQRAEEVFAELEEDDQKSVRQIFMRLVTLGEGSEDTRRVVHLSELLAVTENPERLEEIIETFAAYRLLSMDTDRETRSPTVELAHEALLREWERLIHWLNESRTDIRLQRQLARAAKEWHEAKKDNSFLLRGARLDQFEGWSKQTDLVLTEKEKTYLQASINLRDEEALAEAVRQEKEERLEKRARRVLQALLIVMTIAALLSSGLAYYASQQRQEALRQVSIGLAYQAIAELDGENPERAVLLALEALDHYPYTWQAESALAQIVHQNTLRQMYTDHEFKVLDVVWSPDGTKFASSSTDGLVIIWDGESGEQLANLVGHAGFETDVTSGTQAGVEEIAWSPDGKMVATAGGKDKTARIWDASTGEELLLVTHPDWVYSIDWAPDGNAVVVASIDGTVIVFDPISGDVLLEFSGHEDWINMVRFSPDNALLATASSDGLIRIWDAKDGMLLLEFAGHTDAVLSVEWSSDQTYLATSSADATAKIWELETGEILSSFPHSGEVWHVGWSPDDTQIITSSAEGKLILWDVVSSQQVMKFPGYAAESFDADWSPDGKKIISISGNNIYLWKAQIAELILSGHTDGVSDVAWSPDGTMIASSSNDSTVGIWDVSSGEIIHSLDAHEPWVQFVAWSPDSTKLVSGGWDNLLKVWNIETGENILTFTGHIGEPEGTLIQTNAVFGLTWSPDGKMIASSGGSGWLRVWDAETGDEYWNIRTIDFMGAHLEFSPDGTKILSCTMTDFPQVWDAITGEALFGGPYIDMVDLTVRAFPPVCAYQDWSPSGDQFVTAGWDNLAIVWDAQAYEQLQTFKNHAYGINDVKWAPEGSRIASADNGGIVKIWDANIGNEVLSFLADRVFVFQVDWSPDGKYLVTAAWGDFTPKVWRVWSSLDDLVEYANNCCVVRELTNEERQQFGLDLELD